MNPEPHQSFQSRMDELLVAGYSTQTDPLLTEHLRVCRECERYLNVNKRVIAALGEFQFHVDTLPQKTVLSSVSMRGRRTLPGNLNRKQLARVCYVAFGLFLLGSMFDIGAGRLLEALFQSRGLHFRQSIVSFWVVPSFFILFLFPLLPLLMQREERIA